VWQIPETLRKAGQILKNRVRLLTVIAGFLVIFAFALWWLAAAWFEPPVDPLIGLRGLWSRDMRTVVTLDSLDPDTSTVVAHVSTNLDDTQLFLFDPDVSRQISAMGSLKAVPPSSEYTVYYQRPEIQDLSPIFNLMGLRLIRQEAFAPEFDRVKQSLLTEAPRDSDTVLSIIGEPRMYPFDRYMILFQMQAGAFLEFDKKIARVDSGYNVIPRLPGLVVKEVSGNELWAWGGPFGKQLDALGGKKRAYNPDFWINSGVALSAERPLFLRVLTVVLGMIALISVILASLVSDPSKYLLNSLATFVALWGVRSIITAGAPKTPNLVDFAVLVLFILQVGLVTARFLVSRRWETKIVH
jgi:hypothetical protein